MKFVTIEGDVFIVNQFYRIVYKDAQDRITERVIYITDFIKNKVLIADCLLRNGEERHFKIHKDNLLKIEILEQDFFNDVV